MTIRPFGYHPAYGLTDETRWTILRDAEIFGVREAAENHGVSRSTIYKWIKTLERSDQC